MVSAVVIAAAAGAPAVGAPAQAAPAPAAAIAAEWTASHGNGTASGTSETTTEFFFKTVTIVGDVTSSAASECYRVQLVANHDLTVWVSDVVDHCGGGATGFTTGGTGSIVTSSFSIRLCRISEAGADGVISCGPATQVG